MLGGQESIERCRTPAVRRVCGASLCHPLTLSWPSQIVADAAHFALLQPNSVTGNFFIDEDLLRTSGVRDFAQYRVSPNMSESDLMPDYFV